MTAESLCRETILKIDNVSFGYEGNPVLKGIKAEIKDIIGHGQVVAMLGPSGVGKSTLVNLMAGLETPNSGTIKVYHEGDKELQTVERGMVGVVGQKYPLIRHRTVLGNLLVAARKRKHSEEEDRERCEKYLERFKIKECAKLYPVQLSGGQRQRVAIAQQLLRSEHLILMDEPFSGLDIIMKDEACKLIKEVASLNELNTVIVVTHGIPEALCVADTIWLVGRNRDEKGNVIPGAFIKKEIDLVAKGIAWCDDVTCATHYKDVVDEIEKEFYSL